MKQKGLLKTLLLLCALITGVGNVWADEVLFSDDFSDITTGNSTSTSGSSTSLSSRTGWTEFSRVYQAGGAIKLGASGNPGSIKTARTYNTLGKTCHVVLKVKGWSSVEGDMKVTPSTGTAQTKSYTAIMSKDFETLDFVFTDGGAATTYTIATTAKRAFIDEVTIYTESDDPVDPVDVTGVSLNKTSLSLTTGNTETLTATVSPADATDKSVKWSTSNSSVATVDAGVVTAVAAGTATITVTTVDGDFKATCDVTVTKAPVAAVTLDFTDNTGWGFPTTTTTTSNSYTNNGYTITINATNAYYFDSNHLFMGKNGTTLTFPAFPFNVSKIKVYGNDGGSSSVTFNIFVNTTAICTAATNSKLTHEFSIPSDKQNAGTVYVLKITNANNIRINKIEVFGYENATLSDAGYKTLYSKNALDYEDVSGLKAYIAEKDGTTIKFTQVSSVPAETGVLLKGDAATYQIPVVASSDTDVDANQLEGVLEDTAKDAGIFVLMNGTSGVGFYKTTSAFTVGANTAYLPASVAGAKTFIGFDDEALGISDALKLNSMENKAFFNLAGQRVEQPTKGLYIVGGKKVIIK